MASTASAPAYSFPPTTYEFEDDQGAWSGGLGGRYMISRKFGLHVGLDVAHGPEDGAIYVQFGNAWMRP